MERTKRISVFVMTVALGCSGADDEALGDRIWTLDGGWRAPCDHPALYRNGSRIEYREYEDCEVVVSRKGRLTDKGLAAYIEASSMVSPGTLSSCLATDGVDAVALAFDGTDTFEVRYCARSIQPPAERFQLFMSRLRIGFEGCHTHVWFDAC